MDLHMSKRVGWCKATHIKPETNNKKPATNPNETPCAAKPFFLEVQKTVFTRTALCCCFRCVFGGGTHDGAYYH